jgi:competence protein CoiA
LLTARTKTGKTINLGYNYKKSTLLYLRNKEEFICPICGEEVTLKLGDQRIFHFAHKQGGTCLEFYENETLSHMEGKLQLYQWLTRQRIPAVLEYYDKEIQQRPDIMFEHHGRKFALEYQCSAIPEETFIKRTNTYLQSGYTPLWILADSHIHPKKGNIISLSNFHYLFLRAASTGKYYIPTYCPEQQYFQFIKSMIPFSVKNAFCQISIFPLQNILIESLLDPLPVNQFNLKNWNRELEYFILNWSLHPSPKQNSFLHEIYHHNLNPYLLPPEVGLPVPHSVFIQTPLVIWQTYVFIDGLADKNAGDTITLKEISYQIHKRILKKDITARKLPQLTSVNPMVPVLEYLQHLEQLGILQRKSDAVFQLQRKIAIPRSNREKEEAKAIFFKKNHLFLTNL